MLAQRQRVSRSCSALTVLFCCVLFVVVDIEYVTSMSLDRLSVERNDIQPQHNEGEVVIDDDRQLSALPSRGDSAADMYVLLPAIEKNTIETDAFIANAADGEPDMLMMESHVAPVVEIAPDQAQQVNEEESELSKIMEKTVASTAEDVKPELTVEEEENAAQVETLESLKEAVAPVAPVEEAEKIKESEAPSILADNELFEPEAAVLADDHDEILKEEPLLEDKTNTANSESVVEPKPLDEVDTEEVDKSAAKPESVSEVIADIMHDLVDEDETTETSLQEDNPAEESHDAEEQIAEEITENIPSIDKPEETILNVNTSELNNVLDDDIQKQLNNTKLEETILNDNTAESSNVDPEEISVDSTVEHEESTEKMLDTSKLEESIIDDNAEEANNVEQNDIQKPLDTSMLEETLFNDNTAESSNVEQEEILSESVVEQEESTEKILDISKPEESTLNDNTDEESIVEEDEIPLGSVVEQEETTEKPLDASNLAESALNGSYLPVADADAEADAVDEQSSQSDEIKQNQVAEEDQPTEATVEFVESSTDIAEQYVGTQDDEQLDEKQEETDASKNEETESIQDNAVQDEVVTENAELIRDEILDKENTADEQIAESTETFTHRPEDTETVVNNEMLISFDETQPEPENTPNLAPTLTQQLENSAPTTEEIQQSEEKVKEEVEKLESPAAEQQEAAQAEELDTAIAPEKNVEIESETAASGVTAEDELVQSQLALDEVVQPESASMLTTIIQVPQAPLEAEPAKLENLAPQAPTIDASQQPMNVMDSVLNYVNASFINKHKEQQVQHDEDVVDSYKTTLRSYEGAQVWRIVVQSDKDRKMADELRTKYDGQLWKEVKQEVDYLLKPQTLAGAEQHVRAANLSRIVLIDNLQNIIDVENPPSEEIAQLQNRKGHRLTWQAYHRLDDIHGFFDYLAKTYPDICSVETIGYSLQKRPLKILKISNGNASNPGVWIDGGMHAREWISPASVTYIVNQIVEGWDDLPAYMRNVNWHVHAVANPDGYEYSHTTDRLWRKNMRSHGRQCPGVDLNRNFGYMWGGKGTSANPCAQTYRGNKAFSEPETFYISKYISNFPRGTFSAYLSFHSYGQYILYPWGYDYALTRDQADLDRVARQAGTAITKSTGVKYTVGASATTLYPAAGGSDDWAKGFAGIKYAYTVEMGDTGRYGFILPAKFIEYNGKDAYTFAETVARAITQDANRRRRGF